MSRTPTKWKRLFNAFVRFQNEHQARNCVVVFITRSMNPASYTDRSDVFRLRRDKLCTAELLDENFFHAVFEAIKSITAKLRQLTGSTIDGADLVQRAFGDKHGPPLLVINAYDTETLRMEQRGFMSLLKGPLRHHPEPLGPRSQDRQSEVQTT
jgi:uncharacterized protein (TIGR02391 family)